MIHPTPRKFYEAQEDSGRLPSTPPLPSNLWIEKDAVKEPPPKDGWYIANRIIKNGNWASLYFQNGKWKQWEGRTSTKDYNDVTHYLSPYTGTEGKEGERVVTFKEADWKEAKLKIGDLNYQGLISIDGIVEILGALEDRQLK